MKTSRELWALGCEEGQCAGEIVFAHQALEVCEGLLMGLGLPESPVHEETDCQAPEQTGDQQPIIGSDTAPVVVEHHIQPLVGSILDPPRSSSRGPTPSGTFFQGADHPALPEKALRSLNVRSSVGCRANLHGQRETDVGRAWHAVGRRRLSDGFLNFSSAVK
jgi:hypothetical protein